ncbi:hypothetical protein [Candidatus Trichorickettsia mobilis]|uniref:hypothetical protein n=1 Tax=Candidatus Trichorickettsia mobilis TaxID=1346319 RepID=UPI00292F3D0E|nr:hypothetical protein [Candidatus Trichorickettsia mobilis]
MLKLFAKSAAMDKVGQPIETKCDDNTKDLEISLHHDDENFGPATDITAAIFSQGLHGNIRIYDAEDNFIKNYLLDTNNPFKIAMLGENEISITEI